MTYIKELNSVFRLPDITGCHDKRCDTLNHYKQTYSSQGGKSQLRILVVHNSYLEQGGEDVSVKILSEHLSKNGHVVHHYKRSNSEFYQMRYFDRFVSTLQIPFSLKSYRTIFNLAYNFKPDLIHVHNVFPFISPSVYVAAHKLGIPLIQTIHNYRFFCVNGLLSCHGKPCELCIGGNMLHAITRRCYRNSTLQSTLMATSLFLHGRFGTWHRFIDAFIALSKFSKSKLVECGLPERKISVIPNFLDVNSYTFLQNHKKYLVFIGRLSPEKGIATLLKAYDIFSSNNCNSVPLHVAGDGPLRTYLTAFINSHPNLNIHYHGHLENQEKINLLGQASALVFPSECYENCPYTVLESLAVGTPVLASRLGGIKELVSEEKTGYTFQAGNAGNLAKIMKNLFTSPEKLTTMRHLARNEAKTRFDISRVPNAILDIYRGHLKHGII